MNFKSIPRLYINKELKKNLDVLLDKKQKHYLKNVLRLAQDKKVKLFNGINGEWEAVILNSGCEEVRCTKLIRKQTVMSGPSLYFSLIKNNNLRWLLEKATELGVNELHPIITERVNIRNFNYHKGLLALKEASEVSERLELPKLYEVKSLDDALRELKYKEQKAIFCNESKNDIHISKYFQKNFSNKISFIVGPEGGFSEKEKKNIFTYANVKSVKIHDRIVKAETAAVLVLSIYNSYLALNKIY